MATLGNKAATQHVSLQKQTLTGNGGTSYTLQQSVGSALDVAVFINNTRQEPTVAYSASGTTLTMTGAVNSSDHFYVIFLRKAITTTGLPVDAVATANINANAVTNAKIANSTIDLTSKVTGVLPSANGGTGTATVSMASFAWNALDQNSANTTIPANDIIVNQGNDLAATGIYTCPVNGIYRATIWGMAGGTGSNSDPNVQLYLGIDDTFPTLNYYRLYATGTDYAHFSADIMVSLNANQTLNWGLKANARTLHDDYGTASFKLEHAT